MRCGNCRALGPDWDATGEDALASWNRRPVEACTSFACFEPEEDGFYLFKARQGHQLGPVRVVHLVIRGGEPYEANASDPFDWHGLLAGPIPLPDGWDATDTAQLFAPPDDLAGRKLKRYSVRDLP